MLLETVNETIGIVFEFATNYVDVDYLKWVWWILSPILITFILPLFFLVFWYSAALFLQVYKIIYSPDVIDFDPPDTFWDSAKRYLAIAMCAHARVWHGYELCGVEHLPTSGPVLLIWYHGVLPADYYYALTRYYLISGRHAWTVADRFVGRIPGWKLLVDILQLFPGTVESCVDLLRRGEIVGISPGGVREALFGDEYYRTMWHRRRGFAKIALRTRTRIHVMFTRNIREAYRTPTCFKRILRKLYEKTRLPLVPIYGGFPVKLKTYISEPVDISRCIDVDSVAHEIEGSLKSLMAQHQKVPGSILRGLAERFVDP